jgi:hypothetical protein
MSSQGKVIVISAHATQRMQQRGATATEVEQAIRNEQWRPAQRGKWQVKERRPFGGISPVNQRTYAFKAVEVIFADNPDAIVVVTVKVYYHN